jgi:TonB family protein
MWSRFPLSALLLLAGCAPPTPQKTARSAASALAPITAGSGARLGGCELIHYVRAVYPEEAKKKRIQGVVSLRAIISKTGELRDIQVLEGNPLFVPAALAAARQWRYSPCLFKSRPIEPVTNPLIDFTLTQ